MKEKINLHRMQSPASNGFVCVYFLSLFLTLSLLVTMILSNDQNLMKMDSNLQKTSPYLYEEAAVVHYLNCQLQNKRPIEQENTSGGTFFLCKGQGDHIICQVEAPCQEELELYLNAEKNRIYDYRTIRHETAE